MKVVTTDCCGDQNEYLIADEYGAGRVKVEGTCPTCWAEDPLWEVESSEVALKEIKGEGK